MTDIKRRRISDIRIGDRARTDPGDLTALMDSITDKGLLHPVLITPDGGLVSGYRRLQATRKIGAVDVRVCTVASFEQAAPLLRTERLDPQCAVPMNARDLINLTTTVTGLRTVPAGESRDLYTDAFGMCLETIKRVQQILRAADSAPDRHSTDALALIDRILAGESIRERGKGGRLHDRGINGVWREWAVLTRGAAGKPIPATVARRAPKRSQSASLASAIASLSGLTDALSAVTWISPDVTAEDAAAWAQDVARATTVLRKLARDLKEHSHANAN